MSNSRELELADIGQPIQIEVKQSHGYREYTVAGTLESFVYGAENKVLWFTFVGDQERRVELKNMSGYTGSDHYIVVQRQS